MESKPRMVNWRVNLLILFFLRQILLNFYITDTAITLSNSVKRTWGAALQTASTSVSIIPSSIVAFLP